MLFAMLRKSDRAFSRGIPRLRHSFHKNPPGVALVRGRRCQRRRASTLRLAVRMCLGCAKCHICPDTSLSCEIRSSPAAGRCRGAHRSAERRRILEHIHSSPRAPESGLGRHRIRTQFRRRRRCTLSTSQVDRSFGLYGACRSFELRAPRRDERSVTSTAHGAASYPPEADPAGAAHAGHPRCPNVRIRGDAAQRATGLIPVVAGSKAG